MTAKEFLNELSSTQKSFCWEYLEDGAIRGWLRSKKRATAFDPVTAVLFSRDRRDASGTDRALAALRLGLSASDTAAIRDAVDGAIWKRVDGEVALDGYAVWLREEICCRLSLDADSATLATDADPHRAFGESLTQPAEVGPGPESARQDWAGETRTDGSALAIVEVAQTRRAK